MLGFLKKVGRGLKKADKFIDKYGRGALGRKLGEKARSAFEEKDAKKDEPKRTEKRSEAIKNITNRGSKSTTNRGSRRKDGRRSRRGSYTRYTR
jgi:hypothetical protein